jgi:inosine-uridine nucleoside N-ribohydrolase
MSDAKARLTIIDTDPGIDDAIGILLALASPEFSIAGITTVAGNIGLETTTRNAGRLLAFAGRDDIPVLKGAAAPLSRPGPEPLDLHGEDGLGGVPLPEPLRAPESRAAAEWLAGILLDRPEGTVDVLALGPLTNLAQLFLDRPEAARRIGRIIAMGGAIREAGGFAASLRDSRRPAAVMIADLIEAYFASSTMRESRPLHDPCVMLFALAPDLFHTESLRLSVNLESGEDAGALTAEEDGAPVQVAMDVDAPAVLNLLRRRVAAA